MSRGKKSRQKAYAFGIEAEDLAVWFLRLKGYKILERRYKTYVGEVDIVARKANALVFVEVKARKTFEEGLESITETQKRRIINAARFYLTEHPKAAKLDINFDVIVVMPRLKLNHIQNAWQT